jgi:outer membrane protein assembly factor BamB
MTVRNGDDTKETAVPSRPKGALRMARRSALLLPAAAALSSCSWFDDLFFNDKPPVPGTRVAVMTTRRGLEVDDGYAPKIATPTPFANNDWPQVGGTPTHEAGHLALPDTIRQAWDSGIGEGGGYRRKIPSPAVISAGRVLTMDSDGYVSAYDVGSGSRQWRLDTQADGDRSSNVGGGVAIAGDIAYAATGRGEVIAIAAGDGKILWRKPLSTAARAAPTIADGRVFVPTADDQLTAYATDDGRKLWNYQAQNATTSVLGLPSPAYADGIVVAGFGSGDLVAMRATSGAVVWSDSLASTRGRNSAVDFSAVRGMPVIVSNTVYAISMGGLMLALDLRSGRRLWERDVGSGETPCVAGDWIYIVSLDQQAACINRSDGRVAWVTQLPQWENPEKSRDPITWTGPVLAGDRLIWGGTFEQAISVSPYTGRILGTQQLSAVVSVAPVVAGGTVYLITDDGSLLAFR